MRNRCYRKKDTRYHDYGGRGITVCARWTGLNGYQNFLADMGRAPSKDHSLDRIENSKNYEPGNCRWATRGEQQRNRRNNRMITYGGKTMCLQDWSIETGILYETIYYRLQQGWPLEKALAKPRKRGSTRQRD